MLNIKNWTRLACDRRKLGGILDQKLKKKKSKNVIKVEKIRPNLASLSNIVEYVLDVP